jgi:tetratricopeptide (TPR) repeat protein
MVRLARGDSLGGRFTLIRPLGRGGGTGLWLCRDTERDEALVVKVVARAEGPERVELLRRECRVARRLLHPNVARVHEFQLDDEWAFVTMEWVEGEDLSEWLGKPASEVLDVLVPIADALAHAHALGVVHRDLKPSNVVLGADGSPRLVDFGIAGAIDAGSGGGVRGGGSRSGASPEQLAGAPPSPADDIHAFGALLHAALVGRAPFGPDGSVGGRRSPPLADAGSVPPELAALVERTLAPQAEARPRSMTEVRDALVEIRRTLGPPGHAVAGRGKGGKGPVRLAPPPRAAPVAARVPPTPRDPGGPSRTTLWTIAALLGAALAVWGLSLVPRSVPLGGPPPGADLGPAPVAEVAGSTPEPATASGGALRMRLEVRGEEALARALATFDRLEERAVADWAPERHARIVDELARADALLRQGDREAAGRLYESAERALAELETELPQRVEALLEAGREALDAGRVDEARAAIELARRLAPERADVAAAGTRLAFAGEHEALLEQGREHERRGDLAAAERAYAEAAAVDSHSARAREALARVRAAGAEASWVRAMTEALAALDRGEHERAREGFREAAALKPDAPEVTDGLARAEAGIKLDAIASHGEEARQAEVNEEWPRAVEHHRAVLALDPTILFAQQGLARTLERAELAARMEFHLEHPERLTADEVYAETRTLLAQAAAIEPAGAVHRDLLDRFAALVERAGTPVPVVLLSDGETQVTLYRVGRLGAFERRELTLRPGTYTVVGSRSGYRDVRHDLVVDGETSPSLVVRCVDKI